MPETTNVIPQTRNNNSVLKTLGAVLVVVVGMCAIVTGVYSMVKPMGQRFDFQRDDIEEIERDLQKHSELNNHPWGVVAEIAKVQEQFVEVETQFRALQSVEGKVAERANARLDKIEQELISDRPERAERMSVDAALWERIKALERHVYGQSESITTGEALGAK